MKDCKVPVIRAHPASFWSWQAKRFMSFRQQQTIGGHLISSPISRVLRSEIAEHPLPWQPRGVRGRGVGSGNNVYWTPLEKEAGCMYRTSSLLTFTSMARLRATGKNYRSVFITFECSIHILAIRIVST